MTYLPSQREGSYRDGPFGSDRIGMYELGRPLLGLAPCLPSRDCMGRGTRPHVAHHPITHRLSWCSGVMG